MTMYNRPAMPRRRFGLADLTVALFVFTLLYGIIHLGSGMVEPFAEHHQPEISLAPSALPYYAGRSLLRMFLGFGASLLFTFAYGFLAAKSKTAERILVPLLDILQSVPVLGFLSATVATFMALFPGRLTGVELAAIFAIFTGQAWNMTFSFYHSLITVPKDLQEAAQVYRLNWWQRLIRLEIPYSMIGLVWNSMMSFGGGWFFLSASEAITVLNKDVRLPGIGTYIAVALEQESVPAILWAILTMVIMIVGVDQIFWRPIVAWSQRFKVELTEASDEPTSAVLTLLRRSTVAGWLSTYLLAPPIRGFDRLMVRVADLSERVAARAGRNGRPATLLRTGFLVVLGLLSLRYAWFGIQLVGQLSWPTLLHVLWLGVITLVRVTVAVVIGAAWTIPVGVAIGLNPRLSRIAQPLVQIAASFPANMLFPFITLFYLRYHVNFEIGAIPLMLLGTQWYILFNVIAGAMAIPSDLLEAASVFKLGGWSRWKRLIFPAIFPFLITGCITAAGGAWNASIVSEIVGWGDQTLLATGLGTYITQATEAGNWPGIIWGIVVMSIFVVGMNRLLWHRLYRLAETRYHI